jgi:hypothetical protein
MQGGEKLVPQERIVGSEAVPLGGLDGSERSDDFYRHLRNLLLTYRVADGFVRRILMCIAETAQRHPDDILE